jgi:protein-disulfide isomerase
MTTHQDRLSFLRRTPAALLLALGLLAAGCNDGDASSTDEPAGTPAAEQATPESTEPIPGVPLGDLAEGAVEAPVTIIEYASMTCSHCADFHHNTYPLLKRDFIDTGKVRFIFREFPLDRFALDASLMARCAGEEAYFPLVGKLFEEQQKWLPALDADPEVAARTTQRRLLAYGEEFGLTDEKFEACRNNKPLKEQLANRMEEAKNRYGVRATPSLVINGTLYEGSRAYAELSQYINALSSKP